MVVSKVGHMWLGSGAPSRTVPGAVFHFALLALGLAGLILLAVRRRWEAIPIALLIVGISAVGGLLLAGTRRNIPLMPLVIALAGVSVAAGTAYARERSAQRREQTVSPPAPDRAGARG
jgi:CHASE2 domain-containing sensor protein